MNGSSSGVWYYCREIIIGKEEIRIRAPLHERVLSGLEELTEYAKGERTLRVTEVEVPDPAPEFNAEQVKRIRAKSGISQTAFSRFLSVSPRTLQSWEQGKRLPTGPAARLLQVIDEPETLELIRPRPS